MDTPARIGKAEADHIRQIVQETLKEAMCPPSMTPTRCAGHEELRDIVVGTRRDVKHLSETVISYMDRNDAANKIRDDRVEDLRLHGAAISQQNAEDIRVLKETTLPSMEQRLAKVSEHGKIEKAATSIFDHALTRWSLIIMAFLGVAGFIIDLYGVIRKVIP
jgi:hypothetical protein